MRHLRAGFMGRAGCPLMLRMKRDCRFSVVEIFSGGQRTKKNTIAKDVTDRVGKVANKPARFRVKDLRVK